MHIRSRISAETLRRARERRAWGSLCLCAIPGLALAALAFDIPCPQAWTGGATPAAPTALLLDPSDTPEPTERQRTTAPAIHIPPPPAPAIAAALPQLPPPPIAPPDLASLTLPEWDLDLEPDNSALADILTPPEFTQPEQPRRQAAPPAHRASAPRPTPQGQAIATTPPAYRDAPPPPYPSALRASRAEGNVRVRIAVDASGRPSRVDILSGSGHYEFDTCARDWILKHWLFTPARRGGQAVAGSVTTSVRFVLR